jgi:MoxR-like ATPase
MFKLINNYPTKEQEKQIIERNTKGIEIRIKKIVIPKEILEMQRFNQEIYCDEKIEEYVASIVDATRNPDKYTLDFKDHIDFGASPRASIWLILAAKAHALINGRGYVCQKMSRRSRMMCLGIGYC